MVIPANLPSVGINGDLAKLLANTHVYSAVCDQITDWKPVARHLAKQDAFRTRFRRDKIDELDNRIKRSTGGFLKAYTNMTGSTVSSFVRALYNADSKYWELCQNLCKEAGEPDFYRSLAIRLPVQELPTELIPAPTVAADLVKVDQRYISKDEITIIAQQMLEEQEGLKRKNAELLKETAAIKATRGVQKVEIQELPDCSICLDRKVNVSIKCGHLFCEICLKTIQNCAICRVKVEEPIPYQP